MFLIRVQAVAAVEGVVPVAVAWRASDAVKRATLRLHVRPVVVEAVVAAVVALSRTPCASSVVKRATGRLNVRPAVLGLVVVVAAVRVADGRDFNELCFVCLRFECVLAYGVMHSFISCFVPACILFVSRSVPVLTFASVLSYDVKFLFSFC